MTDHPWPSSETLLAIADTAEDLRKAIWLGFRTTAPDSPARLPGFSECLGQIHQQLLLLDMLFHGRSVTTARSFGDYRIRREKFAERCNELQVKPQDSLSNWGAFFEWQFAEAARPGDEENVTFPDRKEMITCIGSPTWKWPSSVADRYNAIWNIFGALKLFFGQGTEVYCRNNWVRPDKDDIWLSKEPFIRGKDSGFQVPDRSIEQLDANWLDALALQSSQLRDAVKAERIAKTIWPLWWPMRPFQPPLIMRIGPGQPLHSIPESIPLESYQPTLSDQELLQRQIPGVQPANLDWDHVRHYLIARNVKITEETPVTTVLAIIKEWDTPAKHAQKNHQGQLRAADLRGENACEQQNLSAYLADVRKQEDAWVAEEVESLKAGARGRIIGTSRWNHKRDLLEELERRNLVNPEDPAAYSIRAYKDQKQKIESEWQEFCKKQGWSQRPAPGTETFSDFFFAEYRFECRLTDLEGRIFGEATESSRTTSPRHLWRYIAHIALPLLESVGNSSGRLHERRNQGDKFDVAVEAVMSALHELQIVWAVDPPYPKLTLRESIDKLRWIANKLESDERRVLLSDSTDEREMKAAVHHTARMHLQATAAPEPIPDAKRSPPNPDILLITVNEHETRAVLTEFQSAIGHSALTVTISGRVYRNLGTLNDTAVFHAISEMGSGGIGGMQQTVEKAINALNPAAVIAVGIAFGSNAKKQAIGDILVSQQLRPYDLQRIGSTAVFRGDKPHATARLLNHFIGFAHTKWDGATVRPGVILTGEKLIDNTDYRDSLIAFEPEAVGGEMEGSGLYVPCHEHKRDWIVVKAICDWADGNKVKNKAFRQKKAATNAAKFIVEALKDAPLKRL